MDTTAEFVRGLELFDVWFVTYQNVGLEIDNIEIIIKK